MKKTTFVIGGCRSGKSSHALKLAEAVPGRRRLFIATCIAHDDEMQRRVAAHQEERGDRWKAVEVPIDVAEAVADESRRADVVLVDCLTLWVSNLLFQEKSMAEIRGYAERLTEAVMQAACPVILVSNEVGAGVVPENDLARFFRDAVGAVNQIVAAAADEVVWTVAGIPVTVK